MKKTKKTMVTSAILSAALAAQGENMLASPVKVNSSAAPVYGPPPVAGDLNYDGRVDISDYVMLKSKISENGYSYNGDVNYDGVLDSDDAEQFRSFMFGLTDEVDKVPDNDDIIQTTYGPPIASYPELTTCSVYETSPEDNGNEPYVTDEEDYPVTEVTVTTKVPETFITTESPEILQPLYGIQPVQIEQIDDFQTKYGPPPAYLYDGEVDK